MNGTAAAPSLYSWTDGLHKVGSQLRWPRKGSPTPRDWTTVWKVSQTKEREKTTEGRLVTRQSDKHGRDVCCSLDSWLERQLDSWRIILSELKGKLLINPTLTLTGILLQILEKSHRVTRGLGEDPVAQGAA